MYNIDSADCVIISGRSTPFEILSCAIDLVDGVQCKCKRKRWLVVLLFPVNLSGDCQISSVGNFLPRTCRGVEGVVGEVKSVSWGGARTKGEVHKREITSPTTPSTPRHVRGRKSPTLEIWQSPDKFTGNSKTRINVYVYIYIAHHLRGQWQSLIFRKLLTCHR